MTVGVGGSTMEAELGRMSSMRDGVQPITAEVIERAPNLRLIQKIGVGVNTIDLDAAKARGIPVCNPPICALEKDLRGAKE